MGAGKGHVVRWMSKTAGCFPLSDFIVIDPDNFKAEFREWRGYLEADASTAGTLTHLESGFVPFIHYPPHPLLKPLICVL